MNKPSYDTLKFPTILFSIKVYHPLLNTPHNSGQNIKVKLLQEIQILGDQTLSEFKDKIVCPLDYMALKDLSDDCFLVNVGCEYDIAKV